jgi:hypothetical protein
LRRRSPYLVSSAVLLLLVVAFLAACGSGGGSSKDATSLVNTAFRQPIKSADVSFNLQVQVDGVPALENPVSLKFAGPYQSNGSKQLPSMDLNATIVGGGQSVPFGLTSTGDNFFVKVQGTSYEVGKQQVAQINQQLQSHSGTGNKTSLSELGIHPLSWLSNAKMEGDSTVGGTSVSHVSASLDVSKLLNDLNQLAAKAPTNSVAGAKPPQLSDKQKQEIERAIKDPHIDVYVAKSDKTVRRLATTLEFEISKDQQKNFNGVTGGTIQISIEFSNVGTPKKIVAPANAKPISDLGAQLNALGGAQLGQNGSSGSGSSGSGSSGGGSSSGSGGASTTPSSKQFQQYAQCLQKAGGNNPQALQKCADPLK